MIRWKLFATQIEILSNKIADMHLHIDVSTLMYIYIYTQVIRIKSMYGTHHLSSIFEMTVETCDGLSLFTKDANTLDDTPCPMQCIAFMCHAMCITCDVACRHRALAL